MAEISRRTFLRRTLFGAGMLTVFANGGYRIAFAAPGPEVFKVRILHTNDHHARIEPVTSGTPAVLVHGGVSRRKTLIDARRQAAQTANEDLLLLDAGDVFQGTLYFNQYNGKADLEFYKGMQYQAMAIGNHEFDRGQQVLADFITAAAAPVFTPPPPVAGGTPVDGGNTFPVISANIQTAASSPLNGLIQPNVVLTLPHTGKKIGIFGLTTPETAILSSPGAGVTFREDLEAVVAEQVAALQAQHVDAIIGLTHIGYTVDLDLAQKTSGVSLIIGGHSHTPLGPQPNPAGPYPTPVTNKDGESVPVFTDWEWGRWLGEFVVGFDAAGHVTSVTGAPVEVVADSSKPGYVEPNAAFEQRITEGYAPPLEQLRNQEIGSSAVALNGNRSDVRTSETNLGSLIADAVLNKTEPDGSQIAIMNGGGIRTSIDTGPVTLGEVLEVLPFGNKVALVDITGAQVKAALENGVSQVETVQGRFPQVAGIRFTFTPNRPPGERILSLEIARGDGFVPIDPAATYRVVTNDFMLGGGDGYSVFTEGTNKVDTGFLLADVVADYIGTISPVEDKDITGNRITRVNYMWLPLTINAAQPV